MERARWNTELSHKKLNFVICPTFWGHIKSVAAFLLLKYFYYTAILVFMCCSSLSNFFNEVEKC